jgi:catechol 2,3-dioxygenase-like lactoylglutathione lyase family enzyme
MACCPPATTSTTTAARTGAVATVPRAHVHLHLPDLAAGVAFYRAFLGVEPVKLAAGYAKFLPGWAPLNLALSPHAGPAGLVGHLGLQLASREAVAAQLARVRAAGLPVRVEQDVDCCYANQDKFWVRDPAGVEWEVYHLNADLPMTADAAEAATGCCAR